MDIDIIYYYRYRSHVSYDIIYMSVYTSMQESETAFRGKVHKYVGVCIVHKVTRSPPPVHPPTKYKPRNICFYEKK